MDEHYYEQKAMKSRQLIITEQKEKPLNTARNRPKLPGRPIRRPLANHPVDATEHSVIIAPRSEIRRTLGDKQAPDSVLVSMKAIG